MSRSNRVRVANIPNVRRMHQKLSGGFVANFYGSGFICAADEQLTAIFQLPAIKLPILRFIHMPWDNVDITQVVMEQYPKRFGALGNQLLIHDHKRLQVGSPG